MRRPVVVVLVLLLASACTRGRDDPDRVVREIVATHGREEKLTFRAVYTYTISGQQEPAGIIEIVQRPPDWSRKLETTFPAPDGKRDTVARWTVKQGTAYHTCTSYGEEILCIPSDASAVSRYAYQELDQIDELLSSTENLVRARRGTERTIVGEEATCYLADPPQATPLPTDGPQVQYNPTSYRIEACYASDGLTLRLRRSAIDPAPSGVGGRVSTLEAQEVDRTVSRSDIKLPGEVRRASQILTTPTPRAGGR